MSNMCSLVPRLIRISRINFCNSSTRDVTTIPSALDRHFVNRNPRNLEKLRIAQKPRGYQLDTPTKEYWNKIFFLQSARHTTAWVEHFTGYKVASASTSEWCIKKQLYSTKDVTAALNIGRVLALRCQYFGLTELHSCFSEQERQKSLKLDKFLSALEEGGIDIVEPERFYPPHPLDHVQYPNPLEILEENVPDVPPKGVTKKDVFYVFRGFTRLNPRHPRVFPRTRLIDQMSVKDKN